MKYTQVKLSVPCCLDGHKCPPIRSVPIFSDPFPERFSIGTTFDVDESKFVKFFLTWRCFALRVAGLCFIASNTLNITCGSPTRPVKLDDLRGVENKTQEKGLKPQHQVTPLTWNPKKNDDFLEIFESPFAQNLIFQLKLLPKNHRCILGGFPCEKSNRWTCHWKVGEPSVCSHLSITSAAVRCELSMQRHATAVFFFPEELKKPKIKLQN